MPEKVEPDSTLVTAELSGDIGRQYWTAAAKAPTAEAQGVLMETNGKHCIWAAAPNLVQPQADS